MRLFTFNFHYRKLGSFFRLKIIIGRILHRPTAIVLKSQYFFNGFPLSYPILLVILRENGFRNIISFKPFPENL